MAAATNTDPVDFRLRYLTNPRDRDAVRIAAESYGWQKRPSPRNDQKDSDVAIGRGIAFRRHFTTFIGLVAEVRVHKKTGKIVWETELPAGVSNSPMTYMVNGKQYILVAVSGRQYPGELLALALP